MNFPTYSLIQSTYFFLFLFSIIVLLDVLIRFKSPVKLKIFFLLFVLAIGVGSFCSFIRISPEQFKLIRMICPMLLGTSLVQIFTNLYFIQHKKIANIYTIAAYAIYVFLIFYVEVIGYDTVFPKSKSFNLPTYLDFFINLDFVLFNLFCFYYIYNILFKFSFKNIYFKKVQIWTFCFFMVIVSNLLISLFSIVFDVPIQFKGVITITLALVML